MRLAALAGAIGVIVSLLLAEGLSQVLLGMRYGWQRAPAPGQERAYEYDPLLGYKRVPGQRMRTLFGENKPATTNGQGFRATRDFTADIPAGRYRIIFLGDSFTHGTGGDDESFPAQLEALAPAVEAVNMGMGGFGIDQLYLWYKRDGVALRTNALVFAFIEDDFNRMTSDTLRTLLPKPQLVVRRNALTVANVPVPTWGTMSTTSWIREFPRKTALYQVLHKATEQFFSHYEMFPVVAYLFDDLKALSIDRHQELVLVYLPSSPDAPGTGRPPREIARRLEQVANEKQIVFWNLTSMFQGLSAPEVAAVFLPDGHYNTAGNRLVATTLLRALRERFPEVPR